MGSATPCWLCGRREADLLTLRPGGEPDGRRVCRPCVRRLLAYFQEVVQQRGLGALALIFPVAAEVPALTPGEEWRAEVRALFGAGVIADLGSQDENTRAGVAIAYLAMGMWPEAIAALSRVPPEAALDGRLTDRALVSLLSRLFDSSTLAPEGRAELASTLGHG